MQAPGLLGEIENLIGAEHTRTLAIALGGQTINFPAHGHSKVVAALVGVEAAIALSERFAGCIYFPSGGGYYNRLAVASSPDVPARELAQQLGISDRWVYKIRRALEVKACTHPA